MKLFVANYDGVVSVYEVNMNESGECRQISQHLLFNTSSNSKNDQNSASNITRTSSGEFHSQERERVNAIWKLFFLWLDASTRIYSTIPLRNENNSIPYSSPVQTNDRQSSNHSFRTGIDGYARPPLSSTPQSDND